MHFHFAWNKSVDFIPLSFQRRDLLTARIEKSDVSSNRLPVGPVSYELHPSILDLMVPVQCRRSVPQSEAVCLCV